MNCKTKVVLVQLGSPKTTETQDVREYLREFLSDQRVIDINPTVWKLILNLFVLPFRPKKSAEAYKRIWTDRGSPLVFGTFDFADKVRPHLNENIELNVCFALSDPRPIDLFRQWEKEPVADRAKEVLVLPQFPQYSESTIASVVDALGVTFEKMVEIPSFKLVDHYHLAKCFIDGSVRIVGEHLQKFVGETDGPVDLVFSFHGLPLRRVLYKGDPYYRQCFETYLLICDGLAAVLKQHNIETHFCFQSRFGSEQWIGPAVDQYAVELVEKGRKNIAVYCPSFVVDCLETSDEIGNELGEEVEEAGGHLYAIPCLNDDEQWAKEYADYINTMVDGNKEQRSELSYAVEAQRVEAEIPEQVMQSPPLSDNAKTTLKIVFFTLFLDLIGFSIIFPMFPALAQYYMDVDSQNFLLKGIFDVISAWTQSGGAEGVRPIVLFGGVLGALYSLLQFIFAPFWGRLSDRIGRKPVLMVSLAGLAASYLLWFFSGSFTLLIVARLIGGIMAGNISTATAVVADVTEKSNRSKGMAFIGIAFALGFIIGPAMGGFLTLVDLSENFPDLKSWGVNPFSSAALVSFVLTMFNLVYLARKFKESLPPEKRGEISNTRSANPFNLFKPLPYKGTNLTNFGHFLFLLAFSGMEFTITFLAVERLSFTSLDNGLMFIWIGLWIALIQGGFVRRKASVIGEQKVALMGMACIVPGLLILSQTHSTWALYAGLFFLAIGGGMAIPCLTTLVSIYSPATNQGQVIGVFRSLGALSRVIGPMLAAVAYWRFGSAFPYIAGSVFLLIPILMIKMLPTPEKA